MKRSAILVIWGKELTDAMRDPRALLYLVGLPLLFYPMLLLVLERVVSHLNADPGPPYVVSVSAIETSSRLTTALVQVESLVLSPSANPAIDAATGRVPVGIEPAFGLDDALRDGVHPTVHVFTNLAAPGGAEARRHVLDALAAMGAERQGHGTALPPIVIAETVLQPPRHNTKVFTALVPYFLVALILVGSAHMAIDVTAGEKERRTLETLLVSGVDRSHIVLGKSLAALTAAVASALLGILGFVLSAWIATLISGSPQVLDLEPRSFFIFSLGCIPAAVFLSSLLLAVGTVARSVREGQTYAAYLQMPVLLVALSAMFLSPSQDAWWYAVPLLGTSWAQRLYLDSNGNPAFALIAAGSTLAFGIAFTWMSTRLFRKEGTLFRT